MQALVLLFLTLGAAPVLDLPSLLECKPSLEFSCATYPDQLGHIESWYLQSRILRQDESAALVLRFREQPSDGVFFRYQRMGDNSWRRQCTNPEPKAGMPADALARPPDRVDAAGLHFIDRCATIPCAVAVWRTFPIGEDGRLGEPSLRKVPRHADPSPCEPQVTRLQVPGNSLRIVETRGVTSKMVTGGRLSRVTVGETLPMPAAVFLEPGASLSLNVSGAIYRLATTDRVALAFTSNASLTESWTAVEPGSEIAAWDERFVVVGGRGYAITSEGLRLLCSQTSRYLPGLSSGSSLAGGNLVVRRPPFEWDLFSCLPPDTE